MTYFRPTAIQFHEHVPDGRWNQLIIHILSYVIFHLVATHQLRIVDEWHFLMLSIEVLHIVFHPFSVDVVKVPSLLLISLKEHFLRLFPLILWYD